MSDPTVYPPPSARPRRNRLPFALAVALLIVGGLAVYLLVDRERPPSTIKLALVTWTEDPFWEPLIRGAEASARQSNVELTIMKSKPTMQEQDQHVRDLMSKGVDGIAISPNDPTSQIALLNEASEKMPVVTFDSDAPDSKRRRFISIDNYAAGHALADELRDALPDGGPVLISVGSMTMLHGRDRRQGLIDGLLDRGFNRSREADEPEAELKGSKYSVVTTVTDGADPAKATVAIADALKAHPETKAIAGLFSYSAPAALEAMRQVGKAGQLKVVGFDEADETQAAIEAGTIHSSILQNSYRCGWESIQVLADEVRGVARGPAEGQEVLNVQINVLRPDNLADLRASKEIRQPAAASSSSTTQPAM